jgi:hypothetical protein
MSDPEIEAAIDAAFACVRLEAAPASLGRAIAREEARLTPIRRCRDSGDRLTLPMPRNRAASRRRRTATAQNH